MYFNFDLSIVIVGKFFSGGVVSLGGIVAFCRISRSDFAGLDGALSFLSFFGNIDFSVEGLLMLSAGGGATTPCTKLTLTEAPMRNPIDETMSPRSLLTV